MTRVFVAAALSLYASGPRAAELVLDAAWRPNPVLADVHHEGGGRLTSQAGYPECVGTVQETPDLTFRLAEPARVRFLSSGGSDGFVVAGNGGGYWCGEANTQATFSLAAGAYRFYFNDGNHRFDRRLGVFASGKPLALPADAAVPVVAPAAGGRQQLRRAIELGPGFAAHLLDVPCDASNRGLRISRLPAMRLQLAAHSRVRLEAKKVELLIEDREGKIRCDASEKAQTLEAGEYTVLAGTWGAPPARAEVAIEAVDLTVAAQAPEIRVEQLDEVRHVEGTLFAVRAECENTFGSQPDFLVKAAAPMANVHAAVRAVGPRRGGVSMIWEPVSGPATARVPCKAAGGEKDFELFEGAYAVWIGGRGEGQAFDLTLRASQSREDPLALRGKPEPGMSLADRRVENFFPALDLQEGEERTWVVDDRAARLWATAPRELFVFAKVEVPENELVAGEPLLVLSAGQSDVELLGADGRHLSSASSYLALEPARALGFPARPRDEEPAAGSMRIENRRYWALKDVDRYRADEAAISLAHPDDQKKLDAYLTVRKKYDACANKVWDQMDPDGSASDYDVVTKVGGEATSVQNFAEKIGKTAHGKCNGAAEEKAHQKLAAELRASRQARRQKALESAKQRMGSLFSQ
jgi:hypothetical protein